MKIYVAAPWVHKADARVAADKIRRAGFIVTSRWMYIGDSDDPTVLRHEAMNDIDDVETSQALIYLNLTKSEGKATELGMCIAKRKPIFVVGGKDNNVFLHCDYVQHVSSLDEAILRLKEI